MAVPQLDLARLHAALRLDPIGHTIEHRRRVASTMNIAHTLAADPATRSGTVVCAEEQTLGRGRQQRRWHAPAGTALLCSIIVKPEQLPSGFQQLSIRMAVATVSALRSLVPEVANRLWLKWPNDILAIDATSAATEPARKVAGLLVEAKFDGQRFHHAVVGIGINVNQSAFCLPPLPPHALAPGSLSQVTGTTHDRTSLLIELCRAMARALEPRPLAEIVSNWRDNLHTLGKPILVYPLSAQHTAEHRETPWPATALDVTDEGDLIVQARGGVKQVLSAAQFSVRTVPDAVRHHGHR